MSSKEAFAKAKEIAPIVNMLKGRAFQIIERTSEPDIKEVIDLIVSVDWVYVRYCYGASGCLQVSGERIPFDWFDAGFDFEEAYQRRKQNGTQVD